MKRFLVVCEDLLTYDQREACIVLANSKEEIIEKFELVKTNRNERECYFNPNARGGDDVIIYVYEVLDKEIVNPKDFNELIHKFHCDWY